MAKIIDEKKMLPVIQQAKELIINNDDQLKQSKDLVVSIKALKDEVNGTFDPIIKSAHETHKKAIENKKKYFDPLDAAERSIKSCMSSYYDVIDARKREEERKAREEAEKKKQAEIAAATKKLNALLAKSEKLDEQLMQIEAELNDPELTDTEREVLLVQQTQLLARIEQVNSKAQEKQSDIKSTIETPVTVKTETERPKVAGVATGTTLIPEVFNKMSLIKAVAAGIVPDTVLTPDLGVIKKLVNAGLKIPGVQTRSERNVRVGGR